MAKRKSRKRYVSLDVFEKFLRKNGIENERQYAEAYRRKLIPTDVLPRVPHMYYKKPVTKATKLWSFKRARKYVRKLELSGREVEADVRWHKSTHNPQSYEKMKPKLPLGIPKGPQQVYRKDWKGWNDFLGIRRANFMEAKNILRSVKIKNLNDWFKWKKNKAHLGRVGFIIKKMGDMRLGVPHTPSQAYKEWTSWGDFLGTGRVAANKRKFRPYKAARKYAHSLKLKNGEEWKKLSKHGKLPYDLPADPKHVYGKDYPSRKRSTVKGIELLNNWKGWADWLGVKPGVSNRRKVSHKESVARAKKGWANRKKKGNTKWSKDDSRRKTNKVKRKRMKKHAVK